MDAVNARSTLEILMFDPADGVDEVKILLPPRINATVTRDYAPFTWEVVAESGLAGPGPYNDTCTDGAGVSASCVEPPPSQGPNWFQNELVKITVDLNNVTGGYTCERNCWFKVEYTNSANTSETLTWKARLVGDPIRLTE